MYFSVTNIGLIFVKSHGKHGKIAALWASVSAGIFMLGYNIGTGSITSMASAGSEYGMSLTWALVLSCIFTYVMVIAASRYTMRTGQTLMRSFRQYFGSAVTVFIMISLLSAEIVSSMGLMGVSVEVLREWSRPLTADGEGFNQIVMAVIIAVLIGILCWQGRQDIFEKVLSVFVAVMAVSFIVTMFVVIPDPETIVRGLKPYIPQGKDSLIIVSGMVGTTMGAILYVARSVMVRDKGWTMEDMPVQKRDARVSVILMFVLSFAVMACAAGAMRGEHITNAIQMVGLVEPLAGRFATALFVSGIVAAALSSLFPILLLAPWLVSDYKGEVTDVRNRTSRFLIYAVLLLTLTVPVFGGRPVKVVLISQTLTVVATPLVVLFMSLLLNNPKLMGGQRPSLVENVIYVLVFLFTLMMAVIGVGGLIKLF